MSNYNKIIQYGGDQDMVTIFNELCTGDGEGGSLGPHHEYLTKVNEKYLGILRAAIDINSKVVPESIDAALIEKNMNIKDAVEYGISGIKEGKWDDISVPTDYLKALPLSAKEQIFLIRIRQRIRF